MPGVGVAALGAEESRCEGIARRLAPPQRARRDARAPAAIATKRARGRWIARSPLQTSGLDTIRIERGAYRVARLVPSESFLRLPAVHRCGAEEEGRRECNAIDVNRALSR